jgi:hypothetical protein
VTGNKISECVSGLRAIATHIPADSGDLECIHFKSAVRELGLVRFSAHTVKLYLKYPCM